ncbi:MAG TPA: hypothetical protein VEX86_09500 [Longimicrobium sp.]|nr:hypothetical protein [Longimicrobium sp.]
MSLDVLTCNVRAELLVPVPLGIQDQDAFLFLPPRPELARAKKKPQFKRHVEPGQSLGRVELGAGDVVDAVAAPTDDPVDLRDAHLTAVIYLERAPSEKSAVVNGEHQRSKNLLVVGVERAVDEDALLI